MKKLIFSLVGVMAISFSQMSFGAIINSNLSKRHQALIEAAIVSQCGHFKDLTEVKTTEVAIQVDQGIQDVNYSTLLTGLQRMDQNIFDRYEILVESNYADMYDHTAKDWGSFSVSKVACEMK